MLFSFNMFSIKNEETDAIIFGDVKCNCNQIPFTTIIIKGTTISTTTDATGSYILTNLPEGEHTLIAQAFGFKLQEKTIIAKKEKTIELNFLLEEDLIGIDEVVVSSGRYSVNKKYSNVIVTSINTKDFTMTNSVTLIDGLDFSPGLRT